MKRERRGAVRSEAAHAAILNAVATLVERNGFEKLSIEGIASEAGVAKQTIYRWYANKNQIIADCLAQGLILPLKIDFPDTGDLTTDLVEWLKKVFAYLAVPRNAKLVGALIAASVTDPSIGGQVVGRLNDMTPGLDARVARGFDAGVLGAQTSSRLVSEAIFGIIVIRVLSKSDFIEDDAAELVSLLLN